MSAQPRIILLNGPPQAGKDTAAQAIATAWPHARVDRFAGPLKAATHTLFGLDPNPDAFETVKNLPCEEFGGLTPRAAYIIMSERAIKPAFGVDFFGNALVRRLAGAALAVVPDSGFEAEAEPVISHFGPANVLLLRVHRPGFDFRQDSRSYIEIPGVATMDVRNTGPLRDFNSAVVAAVYQWLHR